MAGYEHILFDVDGAVATLTLNSPDTLNALTIAMMAEARDALGTIEENRDIRALILTGAGRGFCSGQNLKDRLPAGFDIGEELTKAYFPVFEGLRTTRVPVVAAINGIAAGGGCSLALAGDIILAARSAQFIQVFSRIGLIPDLGSTYYVPRAIGRARALKMMMTNDPICAEQAAEWGMISEVVEDEKLLETANALAHRLAEGPTRALAMTRKMVDDGEFEPLDRQFRRELEMNQILRDEHDSREGVAAFLEKRPAKFRGY